MIYHGASLVGRLLTLGCIRACRHVMGPKLKVEIVTSCSRLGMFLTLLLLTSQMTGIALDWPPERCKLVVGRPLSQNLVYTTVGTVNLHLQIHSHLGLYSSLTCTNLFCLGKH